MQLVVKTTGYTTQPLSGFLLPSVLLNPSLGLVVTSLDRAVVTSRTLQSPAPKRRKDFFVKKIASYLIFSLYLVIK